MFEALLRLGDAAVFADITHSPFKQVCDPFNTQQLTEVSQFFDLSIAI